MWAFLCLVTGYKKFIVLKELAIKMSFVFNVSNGSRKLAEFSIKNIEVLVDSEEQNWFKRTHVRKSLGLFHIRKLGLS